MKIYRVLVLGASFAVGLFFSFQAFSGALPKPVSQNPEAQKLIDQAWALDRTDSTAEIFKQCIDLIEQADKLDPNNPAILTELSRYYWNYGDNLPKETREQKKKLEGLYAKGLKAAENSLRVRETVDAHYWLAVNKAASLEFSSVMAQAAGFRPIKKNSDYVRKNQPDYYYGASGRLWTEVLSRAPKVLVKIVGWDVKDAVDQIDNAIKKEPRYFDNYLYKARFYYVYYGNKEEAHKLLDTILKQDPNVMPEEVTKNRVSQRHGRELWKKITGKEYPDK